jgi:hypothetical protein
LVFCGFARLSRRRGDKELLLNPITICRNERERCLIEPSVNSLRFSVKIKQMDDLDTVLTKCVGLTVCRALGMNAHVPRVRASEWPK